MEYQIVIVHEKYAEFKYLLIRDQVQHLLSVGADVNQAANDGTTPLIEATKYGNTEIIQALIDKGEQIYLWSNKDKRIVTPELFKKHCYNDTIAVESLLVVQTIDVLIFSSPTQLQSSTSCIISQSQACFSNPYDNKSTQRLTCVSQCAVGANLDQQGDEVAPPLIQAVNENNIEALELLISAGECHYSSSQERTNPDSLNFEIINKRVKKQESEVLSVSFW